MNISHSTVYFVPSILLATLFTVSATLPSVAQQVPESQPNPFAIQHTAMQKLAFLAGHWSGPATIQRSPGQTLHVTQTEDIQYKLDGLVLLIEGKSTDAGGKVVFSALATIAYDDSSHTYRIRAYHDGNYLDTELSVPDNGFSWSFTSGPAHVVNTMHLTAKDEWNETTDVTFGGNPSFRSVEMLLHHQP